MAPRKRPIEERFEEKYIPEPNSGCWIWIGVRGPQGYGNLFSGKRNSAPLHAHRVSWTIYNGSIPQGLWVLHKCDNPSCVNPDHLFLGTNQDNTADKMRKGRHRTPRGERVCGAKLTAQQVLEIRQSTLAIKVLAELYSVTRSNIEYIKRRVSWKHI